MKLYATFGVLAVFTVAIFVLYTNEKKSTETISPISLIQATSSAEKTALFGDGCFWCVEHDIAQLYGVQDVVSGYAGGTTANPTYENYSADGHREVVLVTYDASKVSYANLVEHILKHGDPTDDSGSFVDRGLQYAPAVYYETEGEREEAMRVVRAMDDTKVFPAPLSIVIVPRVAFWPAEEYHQDYAEKNPLRYKYYRGGSGRDAFIKKYWNGEENKFTLTPYPPLGKNMESTTTQAIMPWKSFVKPSDEKLKAILTPLQYEVTQEEGTEPPRENAYDKNYSDGIYVDIISGEPLYSSKDKYDSGTGWPSFVAPITPDAVVLKADKHFLTTRTEVRSRYADSHLGHVFDDGPKERGGKRYCMNSASLRFIPVTDMEREGYGEYVTIVK